MLLFLTTICLFLGLLMTSPLYSDTSRYNIDQRVRCMLGNLNCVSDTGEENQHTDKHSQKTENYDAADAVTDDKSAIQVKSKQSMQRIPPSEQPVVAGNEPQTVPDVPDDNSFVQDENQDRKQVQKVESSDESNRNKEFSEGGIFFYLLFLLAAYAVWKCFKSIKHLGYVASDVDETTVRGEEGERWVREYAGRELSATEYRQFHNSILQTPYGTTQIDHLFVSVYGVFVVETKNWDGWIFGNKEDSHWTQMFHNRKKYRVQNPLKQNEAHVRAVRQELERLEIRGRVVHSVIAFVGDAEIKTPMPANVTVGLGFIHYIKSFRPKIITHEDVLRICLRLNSVILDDTSDNRRKHKYYADYVKGKKAAFR